MNQSPLLYRCQYDEELLREKDVLSSKHAGHRVRFATTGSILEWVKIQYWKLTGGL